MINLLRMSFLGSIVLFSASNILASDTSTSYEASKNLAAGKAFLKANAKKDGVILTKSGLQYKVLISGSGKQPKATDRVTVHYKGALIDGREFDSSYKRGKPASFPVNGVLRGWTEALQLMHVGDEWQLFVPSELAYGKSKRSKLIQSNSTLVFEIKLLKIKQSEPDPVISLPNNKTLKEGVGAYNQKKYNLAFIIFKPLAEQGNRIAQNYIGSLYAEGKGVKQDYAQAAKWYRKAAKQGHRSAQSSLGYLYDVGKGVKQDYAQAAKWYRKAAEQGSPSAQNSLGYLYDVGKGVKQDYSQAAKWYRKAAEQGHRSAQNNLGYLYDVGKGVKQDYAQAAKWYQKAAEQGSSIAKSNLAGLNSRTKSPLINIQFCQSNPFPVSKIQKHFKKINKGCDNKINQLAEEVNYYNGTGGTPWDHDELGPAYSEAKSCAGNLVNDKKYNKLENNYNDIIKTITSQGCKHNAPASQNSRLFKEDLEFLESGIELSKNLKEIIAQLWEEAEAKRERWRKSDDGSSNVLSQWSKETGVTGYGSDWVPGGSNPGLAKIQSDNMAWIKDFQKKQKIRQSSQSRYIDNSSNITTSSGSRLQNNSPTYTSVSSDSKTTNPKPKKTIAENKKTNSCWSGYESGTGCLVTEEDKFKGDIYSVKYSNRCERRIFAKYCNLISGDKMDCGASGIAPGKTKVWSTKNGSGQHRQIYVGSLKGSEDFVCANEISGWHQFPN